jgi:NADH:ubiquinone oxidoreductase subunit 2 (subunit N)
MTLALLLGIGGTGAIAAGWGMSRGDRVSRAAAGIGIIALLAVLAIALAADAPPASAAPVTGAGLVFGGRIVRTDYLRLVVALWALDGVVVIGLAWLLGGLPSLRGLLAGTLAAITGGIVALGATDLSLGIAAAAATGISALVVVLASSRGTSVTAAARELRVTLAVGALLLGSVAVAPIAAALALAGGRDGGGSATGAPAGGEAGAVLGLVTVVVALAVAVRLGLIPFHLRVPRLTDASAPIAMPLLVAWMPLPFAVVGLAVIDHLVAPLALPLDAERWIVIGLALLTLGAAALAAFIQEDLRHATGYLVIADGGLVLLGLAALDPAAWGPTRIWLVAMAASKTALAAWAAVTESRFETRSIPDLRGWVRRSPILAAAFVVAAVATFGLPGWIVFGARGDLARLAAGGSLEALLILAGFLTLPAYLRLLSIGLGPTSSHVARAAPERFVRPARPAWLGRRGPALRGPALEIEMEGEVAAQPGDRSARGTAAADQPGPEGGRAGPGGRRWRLDAAVTSGRRLTEALRRDRTELMSAAVLALAIVAALTSWGALDLGSAANEPAPIVSGPSAD